MMLTQYCVRFRCRASCLALFLCVSGLAPLEILAQPQPTMPSTPVSNAALLPRNAPNDPQGVLARSIDDEVKTRLDRLEKDNQELRQQMRELQNRSVTTSTPPQGVQTDGAPQPGITQRDTIRPSSSQGNSPTLQGVDATGIKPLIVTTAVSTQLEPEMEKKSTWFEASKKPGVKGVWDNHQLWFETEDKAFRFHFGGRLQVDGIWSKATDRVQFGTGGTGEFQDAVNWRRIRVTAEGWLYEFIDFQCEVDFVQTVNDDPTLTPNPATNVINLPSLTDVWVAVNYIPWIGTIRIGNQKPPFLLEHLTSSRYLDFLERSPLFDVNYHRNGGYEPGIEIANWTENERMTWQLGLFKNSQVLVPYIVGGGEYQINGRVTFLPWYQDEGRYMIHLGLGLQYDDPMQSVGTFLRERFLLRNAPPTTQNTVAQAILNGRNQFMAAPEFFMNLGSLSVQAEYLANHMNQISSFQTQSQGTVIVKGAPKTYFSQSAYVQMMYFLTGEYRPYNKTALHSNGAAPTRVVPLRNFSFRPGGGCNPLTTGAWQVGVRYCYSDLSNNGIYGGQINEVTLGLNWFLNPNMRIQWNYDIGYRSDLGPSSNSNGTYQGFGTRLAFDF